MALGPDDLVLCSGTLSPGVPFAERLAAAAGGGFTGISLWARDYQQAGGDEGLSDADLRALLAAHGLVVAELDVAWWWLPGADVSIPAEADPVGVFGFGEDDMFRLADAVGARSLNAVDVFGGDWGLDDAAESFAQLCDRAAEHGLVVHLEFLPWSKIPDAAAAWEVVRRADRPNGGICVDAWHFFRGPADLEVLRGVPGDRVLGIQLDDGPAQAEANLIEATMHERLLPGEGQFDLTSLVDVLHDIGTLAPVGVEVFSDALHALAPAEAARRAGEATRQLLAGGLAAEV